MGKKKKQIEEETKVNEFDQLVSMDNTSVPEETPVEDKKSKKKEKKKKNAEVETNDVQPENAEIEIVDTPKDEIEITSDNNVNKDINEDLYAPFGDKTFDSNDSSAGGEDLYAPFGDKTFTKDALLDSNTSNNNSKLNEDLTIAMEDVKPKDQEIEKLRSDNEYLNNVDEEVIKEHIKKKKTDEEQNVFDLDMIKNYMGKDYAVFIKDEFNVKAAIFGSLYLIYRKIYLGILMFIAAVALITFFIPNIIIVGIIAVLVIGAHVLIGIKFNKMYLNRSYKKIKEIGKKYNSNQDDFILSKSKELGGTNLAGTIAIAIIFGGLIIAGLLLIK